MRKALLVGNCILFAASCVFVFSPLRLTNDVIRLFAVALPAAVGGAYGIDQFPPFYPHLLCGLMKLGWCNSVVLLAINFMALFAALILLYKIMQLNGCSFVETLATITSVQLCWCVAKHVLIPLTDVLLLPFFLGCLLAVMYAERASVWTGKVFWLAIATLIALVAITIRTAALPLFAVIGVVATGITPRNCHAVIRKRAFWLFALILLATLAAGFALAIRFTEFDAEGGYFTDFKSSISQGRISDFLTFFWFHLGEITELSLNFSKARIPRLVADTGTVIMPIVLLFVMAKEWRWLDWGLLLALLFYGIEIFLWPYVDTRFFLPVFPIAAMVMVHYLLSLWQDYRSARPIVFLYMAGFVFMGIVSWGWLAWQWHLGKEFYRHTKIPWLFRDFKNAYTLEIKDIPQNEKTFPVFILKKFDSLHSYHEKEEIPLADYRLFTAQPSN